jgi:hypothetical protein
MCPRSAPTKRKPPQAAKKPAVRNLIGAGFCRLRAANFIFFGSHDRIKRAAPYFFESFLLIFLLSPLNLAAPDPPAKIIVPVGRSITVDGKLAPGEWSDAASMSIEVSPGWRVRLLFKHDAANLYFAFIHLVRGKEMRFPELLLDPRQQRSDSWQPGEWWLHSSFNLCEGNGNYNVYNRNGIFQCAKTKDGWSANHFPLGPDGVMEIEVSLAKLGLKSAHGARLGFSIDLTDTQKNWVFWPVGAQLARPSTWGQAILQ